MSYNKATSKSWFIKMFRLLLVLLLLLAVAAHRGRLFSFDLHHSDRIKKDLFHGELKPKTDERILFAPDGGSFGYGGHIPLAVIVSKVGVIKKVVVGENQENVEFFQKVTESNFLNSWNGLNVDEVMSADIQSVSGATLSSAAIIKGLKEGLSNDSPSTVDPPSNRFDYKIWLAFSLLLLMLLAFFLPSKFKKIREVIHLSSILLFGFYLGYFLSFNLFINWLSNGLDVQSQLILFVILILSIGLPLTSGKSFYCTWVCPYGAAQEIMGKLIPKKNPIPSQVLRILQYTREALFLLLLFFLWIGYSFNLSQIEPFSAFIFYSASTWVSILAISFLLLSIFLSKPWCRFFCPTGLILDFLRGKKI